MKRSRPPQPKGGIFAEIVTAEGVIMGKLCAGPCQQIKPLTDFYRNQCKTSGYRSWCKACEQPRQKVYNKGYNQREDVKACKRLRSKTSSAYRPAKQSCVYIVQLLSRRNTFKIGSTNCLPERQSALRRRYGVLSLLLVMPVEHPRMVERQFHQRFEAFRLYEAGSKTELFQFMTKRGRQALQSILTQFADYAVVSPLWDIRPQVEREETQQLCFL